jgi:hypothetical protein
MVMAVVTPLLVLLKILYVEVVLGNWMVEVAGE